MTPLLATGVLKMVAVVAASAASGLTLKTPVVALHSRTGLTVGGEPTTGWVGPTNFWRARSTPPSRRWLPSLR
jgi:hypothetical protein